MGVPGLFRWVKRNAPRLIDGSSVDPDDPNGFRCFDHVYLDFNGCVHGSLDGESEEGAAEENGIFDRVESEINRLLRCVLPTLLLYIALDGVAPRSKANQQRTRRYRSAMESEVAAESQKEGAKFDRNAITAATPFMSRLTQRLKEWASKAAYTDPRLRGVTIVISGDDCPGEGEHKIMDAVRCRNRDHPGESHCLLGADADLLLLGMASGVEHFYVLREQYSVDHHTGTYDVLRLAALRENLTQVRFPHRDAPRIVDDFVALVCLCGNDFLPALAPCRLDADGLDRILAVYEALLKEWGEDQYLMEASSEEPGGCRLVWPRWEQVLRALALLEQELALESMCLGLGKPPKDAPGGYPPPPDARWDGLTCLLTNVPQGASINDLLQACQPDEGQGSVKITELKADSEDYVDDEQALREASMRPGDWFCFKCNDVQFARNSKCRKCGQRKPEEEIQAPELADTANADLLEASERENTSIIEVIEVSDLAPDAAVQADGSALAVNSTSTVQADLSKGTDAIATSNTERRPATSSQKSKRKGKGKGKGKSRKGSWGQGHRQFVAAFETIPAAVKILVRGPRWVNGSRVNSSAFQKEDTQESDASEEWLPCIAGYVVDAFDYWLSDKNLQNDAFLRRHIRSGGEERFVPIKVFLTFAKMKSVSQDPAQVAQMLKESKHFEVRDPTQSASSEWEVRSVVDNSRRPTESADDVALQQAVAGAVDRGDPEAAHEVLMTGYYTNTATGPVAAGVPSLEDVRGRAACWSRAYLRGVEWVLRYYTAGLTPADGGRGCGTASWHWFYPAHYPPLCMDLAMACKHFREHPSAEQASTFSEAEAPASASARRRLLPDSEGPLSPDIFLMSVLPPQSSTIVANPILQEFLGSTDSAMAVFFPRSVELRWPPGIDIARAQDHQQLVMVPFVEEALLCKELAAVSWVGAKRSAALDATAFHAAPLGPELVNSSVYSHGVSRLEKPSQTLLFVRHCMDEKLKGDGWDHKHGRLSPAPRFSQWQPTEYRASHQSIGAIRDPCLAEYGVDIASRGVNEAVRLSLNSRGYGGPGCGLERIAINFTPELIVSSPLSRSLQTALVMFDQCVATIVVCPALKELEIDDTMEGKFIEGSASCQGMTKSMLQAAVEAHPRTSRGVVDFSQVPEDTWYNPLQTYDEKCKQFGDFLQWLAARKERRIAVVSHGKLLTHWLQATFGHSEYAIGKYCMTESGEGKTILIRNTDGVQHRASV